MPPPPPKRRRGLLAVLVAVVVVVPATVSAVVGGAFSGADGTDTATPSSPPRTLTVPSSFGPYRRKTGSDADRIEKDMRTSMNQDTKANAPGFAEAKIAIYERRDGSSLPMVFVGLSASDGPSAAEQMRAISPAQQIKALLDGVGLNRTTPYPAGPLGGRLRCAGGTGQDGRPTAACAWADSSTLGLLVRSGDGGVAVLATAILALRNAAEH